MNDKVIAFLPPLLDGPQTARLILEVTPAARGRLHPHALVLLEAMRGQRLSSVHTAKVWGADLAAYDRVVTTVRLVRDVDARVMLVIGGDRALTSITPFRLLCTGETRLVLDATDRFGFHVTYR